MKIAVIGGGFSGTSLAAHFVQNKYPEATLFLIEKAEPGLGTAYSTPFAEHLLNVRADQMGALAHEPEGFLSWLLKNEAFWRQADPRFRDITIHPIDFLPRKLYGLYLTELLKEVCKDKGSCQIIHKEATDLEKDADGTLKVLFKDNTSLETDYVVLAFGTQAIKTLPFAIEDARYIPNIWELTKNEFQEQLATTNKESTIAIIGTGLTMVDMMASLEKSEYRGKIIALSLRGHLPMTHSILPVHPMTAPKVILKQTTLSGMFTQFREHLSHGYDWLELINSLRLHTPDLWGKLSLKDKKRFLRHLASTWNKHRHRKAPETETIIENWLSNKRLEIVAGRIKSMHSDQGGVELRINSLGKEKTIHANYVYNCTGPEYQLKNHPQLFAQNLLRRGWIVPDELGLGIKSNKHFQASGPLSDKIYVMGSLLFGEQFETTSVPEIREQANSIARSLIHLCRT